MSVAASCVGTASGAAARFEFGGGCGRRSRTKGNVSDETPPAPVPGDDLVPVEVTTVHVPEAGYPAEVMCRMCRNLMLPDDRLGTSWTCYVCSRRIVVVTKPPAPPDA